MFIRSVLISLFFLLSALSPVFAGTRDPNTPDEKYVEFGKQFPMVQRFRAMIWVKNPKTGDQVLTFQYGSAVIIKPHWALTAAHMTEGALHHAVIVDGKVHTLPYVVWPDEYEEERVGFADIALCYSPDPFDLKFYPPLHRKADEMNQAVTFAGYGLTGTFNTGATFSDDKKRAGHNNISGEFSAVLTCKPDRVGRFPLEFMIAPGDSGGGMFIGNNLAGINSFLLADDKKPDGTYTDESAFTRVSMYADWVDEQIAAYELKMQGRSTLGPKLP